MKHISFFLITSLMVSFACKQAPKPLSNKQKFQASLDSFVASKKADIGIAIISEDGKDTFHVNGNKEYVMMSVVKFPQALCILSLAESNPDMLKQTVYFDSMELKRDTWSPLGDQLHRLGDYTTTLMACFPYSVGSSDNIVCDKLYDFASMDQVTKFVHNNGDEHFGIGFKYKDMKKESLNKNFSSAMCMAKLLYKFDHNQILKTGLKDSLWNIMAGTSTGQNRLKAGLPQDAIIAHKTGTFFDDSTFIEAFNDVGIVKMNNGKKYYIAVLVNNSKELEDGTSAILSEINRMTYAYMRGLEERK
ncbi:MAG TPA: serine hydrolase [Bacteroidia bacterium]